MQQFKVLVKILCPYNQPEYLFCFKRKPIYRLHLKSHKLKSDKYIIKLVSGRFKISMYEQAWLANKTVCRSPWKWWCDDCVDGRGISPACYDCDDWSELLDWFDWLLVSLCVEILFGSASGSWSITIFSKTRTHLLKWVYTINVKQRSIWTSWKNNVTSV